MHNSRVRNITLGTLAMFLVSTSVQAATVTFNSSGNSGVTPGVTLSAQATFTVDTVNRTLTLQVTNASGQNAQRDGDILSAIFWNTNLVTSTLTPRTATTAPGSDIANSPGTDPTNVGGEWGYGTSSGNATYAYAGSGALGAYGVSSTGLGLFGSGNFCGSPSNDASCPNLGGSDRGQLQGADYGIVNAGYMDNSGNGNINVPLVRNSVVFVFDNLPTGFTENNITGVQFSYSTSLTQNNTTLGGIRGVQQVPEPTFLIGMALLAGGGGSQLMQRRKGKAISKQ